ncbi:CBN-FLP-21 protein [Caenorhabditis brenneri]|uniref:CBN-FLP-21 protein n=1 Tax=Caenorhabditis brenneri TaxID=135651 RepID=G0MTM7_CAEBE|nr:CBN-FLP-21 protein [Caenorhabditis brenneri]
MRLFILLSCLLAWVLAAPYIDQEDALRVLNAYLEQFGPGGGDKVYYVAEDDHGSMKRGLGPRPLRFG